MKKLLNNQRLILCLCIALFLPYISLTQEVESGALLLGFPCKFYTIYTQHNNAIHFNIGSFPLDVFIIYLICTLILTIVDKVKKVMEKKDSRQIERLTSKNLRD